MAPTPFHDPARPGPTGTPRWFNDWGVLPGLYATPADCHDDGLDWVWIEIMVPVRHNNFNRLTKMVPLDAQGLFAIFDQYYHDPEGLVEKLFGYQIPVRGEASPQKTLTLDDLL